MSKAFHTIGIFGRVKTQGVIETLHTLIAYLQKLGKKIIIDQETANALGDHSIACVAQDELSQHCDLLIVVGGDGSFIKAAHQVINDGTPVLGINRGRLGFLTDILPSHLHKIEAILNGEYRLEKRFLLSASVTHNGQLLGEGNALNEVALIPDSLPHMNEFEIYIDNEFLCSQDSDGLIIATPTGSTAYALSGGGPILHPQLDAMVMVPMFPHTLSNRPIVIDGNHTLTIKIAKDNSATPRVTYDSQGLINTPPGSEIKIIKKPQPLHLIHPMDYNYYETLRSKLHWGRKPHHQE